MFILKIEVIMKSLKVLFFIFSTVVINISCTSTTPIENEIVHREFQTFTESDGLPSNSVYALGSDANGSIWIGYGVGGGGVTKYNGSTWVTFTTDDGLAHNYVQAVTGDDENYIWASFGPNANGICRY